VISHARALLTSTRQGACDYIDADLRDTETIRGQAAVTLDFSKPMAIMLIAILHCIPDADDPHGIVTRFLDAVPSGSFIAISHPASALGGRGHSEMQRRVNPLMSAQVTLRTRTAVTQFFDGLWILKPGIVVASEWRPTTEFEANVPAAAWVGVGHKR
jgi:hypothetical protein